MNANALHLLAKLANELPAVTRQAASDDATLRTAGILRLQDFCGLLAPYMALPGPKHSRRAVMAAGVTFVAMALKRDD